MSKIEKLPIPLLRLLAPLAARFPQQILTLRYKRWTGKTINWAAPDNLQEFIFKKIIDASKDKELLQTLAVHADKVGMRGVVAAKAGEEYLPKLYGVWERVDDIDWACLPQKFAIKTNNNCGTNIIVRDKSTLDIADARRRLAHWLKFPYGELSGQPHYSYIKPLILAEELLEETVDSNELPHDYKFFCFKGVPKFILYYEGRTVNGHVTPNVAFDLDWNKLNNIVNMPTDHDVPAPESLALMRNLAAKLSDGFDFARVDFYQIGGKPIIGEFTFTPDVTMNFTPEFLRDILKEVAH